jgi:hypothetical protein
MGDDKFLWAVITAEARVRELVPHRDGLNLRRHDPRSDQVVQIEVWADVNNPAKDRELRGVDGQGVVVVVNETGDV